MISENCQSPPINLVNEVSQSQLDGQKLSLVGAVPLLAGRQGLAPEAQRTSRPVHELVQAGTQAGLTGVGREAEGRRRDWIVQHYRFGKESLRVDKCFLQNFIIFPDSLEIAFLDFASEISCS